MWPQITTIQAACGMHAAAAAVLLMPAYHINLLVDSEHSSQDPGTLLIKWAWLQHERSS